MQILPTIYFSPGATNHVIVGAPPKDKSSVKVNWKVGKSETPCKDVTVHTTNLYGSDYETIVVTFTMGDRPPKQKEGDTDQIEIVINGTSVTVPATDPGP